MRLVISIQPPDFTFSAHRANKCSSCTRVALKTMLVDVIPVEITESRLAGLVG
jgi:hypothetical protein